MFFRIFLIKNDYGWSYIKFIIVYSSSSKLWHYIFHHQKNCGITLIYNHHQTQSVISIFERFR